MYTPTATILALLPSERENLKTYLEKQEVRLS